MNNIKIELARMTGFLHSMARFQLLNNSYTKNGEVRLIRQKNRYTSLALRSMTKITRLEMIFVRVYLMKLENIKRIGLTRINLENHEEDMLHLFHFVPGMTNKTYIPLNFYEINYGNITMGYGVRGHNELKVAVSDYDVDYDRLKQIDSDILLSVTKLIIPVA